mmetsp:Transcript_22909/g.29920  ORF Transcript_22909/g.29920 Transcript_22909/m.29920 type:complete len:233 (-) Transcript_22909:424-1122(-)
MDDSSKECEKETSDNKISALPCNILCSIYTHSTSDWDKIFETAGTCRALMQAAWCVAAEKWDSVEFEQTARSLSWSVDKKNHGMSFTFEVGMSSCFIMEQILNCSPNDAQQNINTPAKIVLHARKMLDLVENTMKECQIGEVSFEPTTVIKMLTHWLLHKEFKVHCLKLEDSYPDTINYNLGLTSEDDALFLGFCRWKHNVPSVEVLANGFCYNSAVAETLNLGPFSSSPFI